MSEMYCFVGDLLGFRGIIRNLEEEARAQRVADWIGLIREAAARFKLPKLQLVSDTIFAGAEASEDGLRSLLSFSQHLLQEGIQRRFPVRGAIAFGDVVWEEQIAFGPAIVEAYELGNAQNWIGVSCAPSLPHIEALWSPETAIAYPTPLKSGRIRVYPVVPWQIPSSDELARMTVSEGLTYKGELLEWSWGEKFQNTILFSIYLKLARAKIAKGDAEPSEFYGKLPVQVIEMAIAEPPST